jgi:hypothetical protein
MFPDWTPILCQDLPHMRGQDKILAHNFASQGIFTRLEMSNIRLIQLLSRARVCVCVCVCV